MDPGSLAKWEGKIEDVSLEDSVQAYEGVVEELRLEATDQDFNGRVMEHRATWPTGPFGGDTEASVTCKIEGKKDGVILTVGVEGSQERLEQILRGLERRGVPVPDDEDNP